MRLSLVDFALQRRLGKINPSSLSGEPSMSMYVPGLGPGVDRSAAEGGGGGGGGVYGGGFSGLEAVWLDPGWGRAGSGWLSS